MNAELEKLRGHCSGFSATEQALIRALVAAIVRELSASESSGSRAA